MPCDDCSREENCPPCINPEWTFDCTTTDLTDQDLFEAIMHPVVDGHLAVVKLPPWKYAYLRTFLAEYRAQVLRETAAAVRQLIDNEEWSDLYADGLAAAYDVVQELVLTEETKT